MRDGTRAALSVTAAAGFFVVAWLQVGVALLAVGLVLAPLPGSVAVRLAVPLAIATGGLLSYATVRALRLRRPAPAGVPVTRADAPDLWRLVDAAAVAARVAPPDAVVVVAGATAVLSEHARWGGLRGGRRELLLGLPLLQAWDEPRLRAVIAHELAHGSPALGRLAPAAYRARLTLGRIVPRIPRRSPVGPLLRAYAKWYRAIDTPASRAQELAADRIAAAFAGAPAAAAVLRDAPVLDGMQQLFHAEYLSPGWQAGHVPDDVFGGFLWVLAARHEDAALMRAQPLPDPGAWDPHPSVTDRLAALAALTATEAPGPDRNRPGEPPAPASSTSASSGSASSGSAPASSGSASSTDAATASADAVSVPSGAVAAVGLNPSQDTSASSGSGAAVALPPSDDASAPSGAARPSTPTSPGEVRATPASPDAAAPTHPVEERAAGDLVPDLPGLGRALQDVAFPPAGRAVVGWDEFFGVARTAEMEREADASLRSLARVAGVPVTGAADVLELAADGRLRKVAETVFGDLAADETTERITDLLCLLFALAALHSGVAGWRHSWSGAAELVAIDGGHLDLGGPAALAGDPATVGEARERLAALGIDLAARPADRAQARVPVLGGVVNVLVDGARTDLLVTETGLFLVSGLPRSRHAEAKRRLSRLASEGVLADGSPAVVPAPREPSAAAPSTRFVPFADVAAASVTRTGRRAWEMSLRDGGTLSLRTALDSDELPGGWTALDDAVEFLSRTR